MIKHLRAALALAAAVMLSSPLSFAASIKPLGINPSTGQDMQIGGSNTIQAPTPSTANASLNIPHGTAPSSPNNGDVWTTTSGLYVRINGATIGPLSVGLSAIGADNLLMNATGSAAAPTGVALPSCPDTGGQHLNFSSHAWSCGTSSGSTSLPSIASGHVLGNGTGSTAAAADSTLTSILDQAFGSTQGMILIRGSSVWQALAAGTSGYALVSNGPGTNPSYQAVGGGGGGVTDDLKAARAATFMNSFGGL